MCLFLFCLKIIICPFLLIPRTCIHFFLVHQIACKSFHTNSYFLIISSYSFTITLNTFYFFLFLPEFLQPLPAYVFSGSFHSRSSALTSPPPSLQTNSAPPCTTAAATRTSPAPPPPLPSFSLRRPRGCSSLASWARGHPAEQPRDSP